MCFVWISEQTAIISVYSINLSFFKTEADCLLRGTKWGFKSERYIFLLKGLICLYFRLKLGKSAGMKSPFILEIRKVLKPISNVGLIY